MQSRGKIRPLAAAAFFTAVSLSWFALTGHSSSTAASSVVWFSAHKALKAVDTETNQVISSVDLQHEPKVLAVNPVDQTLAALVKKEIVRFRANGAPLARIDLTALEKHFPDPKQLALNPYTGAFWVAAEKQVLHISADGQRLGQWSAPAVINAIDLDLDESVWLLTQSRLFHVSPSAQLLASVDLKDAVDSADHLVVDSLGGILWIADKSRLWRVNSNQLTAAPRAIPLPLDGAEGNKKIVALDIHPVFGTVWAATRDQLLLFDRSGAHLKTVAVSPTVGTVNAIAFDPSSLSLWIAGKNGVGRYTGSGDWVVSIPAEKEAERLGVPDFQLFPTVSIADPTNGALTNNPRPLIRLSLGAGCSGSPCLLADAYTRSLHLDVDLNGEAIGSRFTIDGPDALYFPSLRLPEGGNTVTAQATDVFGHRSTQASARFTIDTVPPKFLSVAPADGGTVKHPAVTISGAVDDPTAHVVLSDGGGAGIAMGGATFNFAVTLKPGLNSFWLTARDPAGNQATAVLRLIYNPISVKITRPTAGAVLNRRSALVSGEFQGPVNTGITVNGVVAQVFENRFYAHLPLQSGSNTVTATATTPDGGTATDSIVVTVDTQTIDTALITVEPAAGIAPLKVRFSVANSGSPISRIDADFDGNGSADFTATNANAPIEYTYTTPGVYEARFTVTDSQNGATSQTFAIVVYDGQQMDRLFGSLWGGMNDALKQGNVTAAAAFLNDSAKRKYVPVFEALKPHFPQIIASYSPLKRVSVSEEIGEYAVVRNINNQNRLYLIYFLKDENGVWRVDGM